MRRFVYLDIDTLNSYIAQIFDGLIKTQEIEEKSSTTNETENKVSADGRGGLGFKLFGKGLEADLGLGLQHARGVSDTELVGDVQTKILHDNAFEHLMQYLEGNKMLQSKEVGAFVLLEDYFYIVDLNYYERLFGNESFIKMIKNDEIQKRKQTLDHQMEEVLENSEDEKQKKDIKKKYQKLKHDAESLVNQEYDNIKSILAVLVSAIPYARTMCIANNMIVLNEKHMRDTADMTSFKYGGKIKVLGYITNRIGDRAFVDELPDIATVGTAINEVMLSFFTNHDTLNIVHPIAIYYE